MTASKYVFALLGLASPVSTLDCSGLKVIKNLKSFTATDKANLQKTLHAMRLVPSQYNESLSAYDYFPYGHAQTAVNSSTFVGGRPVHGSWWFLPWHRELIRRMDEELERVSRQIGITDPVHFAYWNTSDPEANELFFRDDYMGGSGTFHGAHDSSNYALEPQDNHPFGPQSGWIISEDLRYLHAEQASNGSLVRNRFGNGQMGCIDVATRTKHFKLPGADNPPSIDFYDTVQFVGGTRLEPMPDFFGSPDPQNLRCARDDNTCEKYYHNKTTGESIVCRVYGGRLPTWEEMKQCQDFPYEDDVNYNFTTLPDFLVPCLEGMNSSDPFSRAGEMQGASWHSPHGMMHTYTGGTSGESPASANDPIFFGIHAMIDYLWFQNQVTNNFMDPWFEKHPEMLDMELPYFQQPPVTIRETLNAVGDGGFAYDTNCDDTVVMV